MPQLCSAKSLSRFSSAWKSYTEISDFVRATANTNQHIRPGTKGLHVRRTYLHIRRSFSSCRTVWNDTSTSSISNFFANYKASFEFPGPSHEISSLEWEDAGTKVVLHGYLMARVDVSKQMSFVWLKSKDLNNSIQLVSLLVCENGKENPAHSRLKEIRAHSPVLVRGTVKSRKAGAEVSYNSGVKEIRNVEVVVEEIQLLNEFPKDIIVTRDAVFPPEQRHMQIRMNKDIRDALSFRAKVSNICRQQLTDAGFIEIETPLLFKSTPEGAREFLVPTRTKGLAYALPQSPQQYKQILMASGIPKYFQIARCFRDEDLRADRQPEFTQLDLEMSFAKGEDVMQCIETLVRRLWKDMLGYKLPEHNFLRMSYHDAMSNYGSDKPDLRFDMKIHRIGHMLPAHLISKIGPLVDPVVEVMNLKLSENPGETRKFVSKFMDSPEAAPFLSNPDGQPGIFYYDLKSPLSGLQPFGFEAAEHLEELLELEQGDLVVLQARKRAPLSGGSTPIGNLRLALHKAAVAMGYIEQPKDFKFVWITDFPLFSPTNDTDPGQGGSAGLSSTHHPFTAPKSPADVDLLLTDPSEVKAEHYDIVVNGVELGGGSRRIHDARVQEFILRDVLRMSEERLQDFRHLLNVLHAGCPPHAGIALGFDRLIAVMTGKDSVRDVIAFPKSGKGEDLLVKAPNAITKEQLETYHLQLKE
ncbi:putative aspartyl-tRNA synthetase [Lepidopterella palustris CBS 459.81]|uniref:Putative aspartyl-tRNA synthetase n=1 Tax=Lepidopterella palustris CBS 459.81 TaxID=1314670 RepID=A0A8E2E6W1_9PEZI|nr:putative aspartyl-tRNA synthetase [Lepidopterella palustris CBS 459.81]